MLNLRYTGNRHIQELKLKACGFRFGLLGFGLGLESCGLGLSEVSLSLTSLALKPGLYLECSG